MVIVVAFSSFSYSSFRCEHLHCFQYHSMYSPFLTFSGTLTVTLEDTNDNAPEFSQHIYTAEVSESENIGSIVLQVSSQDADDNQIITYLVGRDEVDAFRITNDGRIEICDQLYLQHYRTLFL